MIYERIKYGVAKKWEFIYYDDYNNDGVRYPLREGKSYTIVYDHSKDEIYVDSKQNLLIRMKNITMYAKYKNIIGNFRREKYLKPIGVYSQPTGAYMVNRYFAKYLLEKHGTSFEISSKDYSVNSNFYIKVALKWMLTGVKEVVLKKNLLEIERASKSIPELKSILDPLEFYREEQEELTPQEITKKRLEKLLHNTHSYSTRQEAINISNALGLSGAHQMSDGTWMPGSSHQAYTNAMQQNTVTTPAGVIPTRNITGRSGY